MTSDQLRNQLNETWCREQSADDAHDAIWGEPFDGETVRISDISRIIDNPDYMNFEGMVHPSYVACPGCKTEYIGPCCPRCQDIAELANKAKAFGLKLVPANVRGLAAARCGPNQLETLSPSPAPTCSRAELPTNSTAK